MTVKQEERFHWDALVPHVIHPVKVTIVEAMLWIERPLSSTDLVKLIDDDGVYLSHVAYHVRKLADAGAIAPVWKRQVRGSIETFYFFSLTRGRPAATAARRSRGRWRSPSRLPGLTGGGVVPVQRARRPGGSGPRWRSRRRAGRPWRLVAGDEFGAFAFVDLQRRAEDGAGLGGQRGRFRPGLAEGGGEGAGERGFGVADEEVGAADAGRAGADRGADQLPGFVGLVEGDADALGGAVDGPLAAQRSCGPRCGRW